jgi:hypothetical protein
MVLNIGQGCFILMLEVSENVSILDFPQNSPYDPSLKRKRTLSMDQDILELEQLDLSHEISSRSAIPLIDVPAHDYVNDVDGSGYTV